MIAHIMQQGGSILIGLLWVHNAQYGFSAFLGEMQNYSLAFHQLQQYQMSMSMYAFTSPHHTGWCSSPGVLYH